MPRTPVDYSKTIIYKIQHMENESLVYVGSTTDFTKRKSAHKSVCNNINNKAYNQKIYSMIRENGGWEAFNMIEIEKYPCNDKREAEKRENEIMIELKANMNAQRAHCGYDTIQEYKKQYRNNNKETMQQYYIDNKDTRKEKMKQYYIDNKDKKNEKMTCECGCIYTKQNLTRHKKSQKHIQLMNKTIE